MYMKLFSTFFFKVCLQHNWLTTIFIYNWLPQLIKIEICALPPISGRQAEYSVLLKSEFLFPSFINNAFEVAVAATFLHSISVTMPVLVVVVTQYHSLPRVERLVVEVEIALSNADFHTFICTFIRYRYLKFLVDSSLFWAQERAGL